MPQPDQRQEATSNHVSPQAKPGPDPSTAPQGPVLPLEVPWLWRSVAPRTTTRPRPRRPWCPRSRAKLYATAEPRTGIDAEILDAVDCELRR